MNIFKIKVLMRITKMKKSIRNKILTILEERDSIINSKYERDGLYYILADAVIIVIDEKIRDVKISFHVTARPDEASILTILISQLKNVSIIMQDLFTYNKNGDIIEGVEAFTYFKEEYAKSVIKGFMKQQQQLFILHNASESSVH